MSTSAAAIALPQLSKQQKVFTLAGVLLGMFLAALDQNVVGTAGPAIQKALHIEPSLYVWITTAYMVASTVLVPVYGKLSDIYGRKRIILIGISLFLIASVLCGLAQTTAQLIFFRAIQGLGSASLFTTAFAVIADLFPPSERGKYSGLFGAVFGVSSLVGPLLGGFITDHFGWHWVFFINLPIGFLALFFITTRMPPLKRHHQTPPSVDVIGAVILAVAIVPLLIALSLGRSQLRPGESGFLWSSAPIIGMLSLSAAGVVGFITWEKRHREPLIDMKIFSNRIFATGNATVFVLGAAFLAPMIFLPLFMVNVVGVTATASGLTISPLVMGIVAGNVLSGQLVSRLGKYKPLMLISLLVLMAGFAVMGFTLTPGSSQGEVTVKMVLVGLGLGPSIPLYTLAIQNSVRVDQIGVATSVATLFRQLGGTIGIAVAGTLFANHFVAELSTKMAEATRDLPPGVVQQFQRSASGGDNSGEGQGSQALRFDSAGAKDRAHLGFSMVRKALKGDSLAAMMVKRNPLTPPEVRGALETGTVPPELPAQVDALETQAMGAIDAVDLAMKTAFTSAVRSVYQLVLVLAALAFALTLLIPQIPLRRTMGPTAPVPAE